MVTRGVLNSEALSRDGLRVTGYGLRVMGLFMGRMHIYAHLATPACVRLPDPIEAQPATQSF